VILDPEPFGEDGSIELILNRMQPPTIRVSAKEHVSQIVERLERDTTLKLQRQILVQVQAPGLAELPAGVRLEGMFMPMGEERDQPQLPAGTSALTLNFSKFSSAGELKLGVDKPGRYALWLRISVAGDEGRKAVILPSPAENGRAEVFDIAPAKGVLEWSVSSSSGELQLSEALRKLESKLWD